MGRFIYFTATSESKVARNADRGENGCVYVVRRESRRHHRKKLNRLDNQSVPLLWLAIINFLHNHHIKFIKQQYKIYIILRSLCVFPNIQIE
jgi:late competence protein required for DNA uptake (superfamily II DNA/RNA helicase)